MACQTAKRTIRVFAEHPNQTYFLTSESPPVILSYAEVQFSLAEAVARGFISGNADTYYKEGIAASLKQFGVTDATVIATYCRNLLFYTMQQIIKNLSDFTKWIAFYGQGLDAFAECAVLIIHSS